MSFARVYNGEKKQTVASFPIRLNLLPSQHFMREKFCFIWGSCIQHIQHTVLLSFRAAINFMSAAFWVPAAQGILCEKNNQLSSVFGVWLHLPCVFLCQPVTCSECGCLQFPASDIFPSVLSLFIISTEYFLSSSCVQRVFSLLRY